MSTPSKLVSDPGLYERQPVVILLDVSASMARPASAPRIDEVNNALTTLFEKVRSQARLRARVEVCLVVFGSEVRVFDPDAGGLAEAEAADSTRVFVPVDQLAPPGLRAEGYTRLLPALDLALRLATGRRKHWHERQMPALRPLIWLLTDGAPSDEAGRPLSAAELAPAARRIREAEAASPPGDCVFLAIGVSGADQEMLQVLAPNGTFMLEGLSFSEILKFLIRSSDRVSSVTTAEEVHARVAQDAELQRQMRELEEEVL